LSDSKAWPIKRWAALLRRVQAQMPHALLMICGAPEETFLLEEIRAATQLSDLVTATPSLRRMFALCELAEAMISVDSGPAHAAAALSLPVLILFGEYPQKRWLPRAHPCAAVVGVGGPPASTRVEQISVDTAFAAWCSLRAQAASAPGEMGLRAASQH
jgi:heptosyltransferase-2/heptosyltransferase-3